MAVSQQERELVARLKAEGKSVSEIVGAIGASRAGFGDFKQPTSTLELVQQAERNTSAGSNLKTGFNNAVESFNQGADRQEKINERDGLFSKARGTFANGLRTAGSAITNLGAGALRALPGGDTVADGFNKGAEKVGQAAVAVDDATGNSISGAAKAGFNALPEGVQETAQDTGNALLGGLEIAAPITGVGAASSLARTGASATTQGLGNAGRSVLDATGRVKVSVPRIANIDGKLAGAGQILKETGDKIERGFKRTGEILDEKGNLSNKIKTLSSDSELNAIRAGIPDQNIKFLKEVDTPTLTRFKDLIKTADDFESSKTARVQPKNLAGEDFINAFKSVESKRKEIGSQIGAATQKLSKSKYRNVNLAPRIDAFEQTLQDLGITVSKTKNKQGQAVTKFNYSDTGFTQSQRKAIDELYGLMIEGGRSKSPYTIWQKDSLFSKFQREKLKDNVSDLNYTDAEGNLKNLFTDARNVYSDTLSEINPEIRALNTQYREYARINEQVRKDFLKSESGKIADETSNLLDFSDTAGLSLQRVFSNADGGVKNGRIVDLVMKKAQENGYTGANPLYTAQFARDLEDLFELAPQNSFAARTAQGVDIADNRGIGARALDTLQNLGGSSKAAQREAIEKMIDELISQ